MSATDGLLREKLSQVCPIGVVKHQSRPRHITLRRHPQQLTPLHQTRAALSQRQGQVQHLLGMRRRPDPTGQVHELGRQFGSAVGCGVITAVHAGFADQRSAVRQGDDDACRAFKGQAARHGRVFRHADALGQGQHIRVDIVLRAIPKTAAWYTEWLADVLGLACCVLMMVNSWSALMASYRSGSLAIKTLVTPEWWSLAIEMLFRMYRLWHADKGPRDDAVSAA